MADEHPWGDWRTDTTERTLLTRDDRTRSLPPVPALPATPADLPPSADPPRAARWPLFADGGPATADVLVAVDPTPVTPRRTRSLVPWVAAATVVALAAGTAGTLTASADQGPVRAYVDSAGLGPLATTDPGSTDGGGSDRPDASSRGASGAGADRADRSGAGGDADALRPSRRDARPVVGDATASAPSTAPPNVDTSGSRVTYGAENMLDGAPETAWRVAGNARDTVLTVRLDSPTVVTTVGVLNGYAKSAAAGDRAIDWYGANRRVRQVEWFFDDGSRVVQNLRETPEVQRTDIRPTTTSTVRMRISAVSPPGRGRDGRDYTAVSELAVDGVLLDDARGASRD